MWVRDTANTQGSRKCPGKLPLQRNFRKIVWLHFAHNIISPQINSLDSSAFALRLATLCGA